MEACIILMFIILFPLDYFIFETGSLYVVQADWGWEWGTQGSPASASYLVLASQLQTCATTPSWPSKPGGNISHQEVEI